MAATFVGFNPPNQIRIEHFGLKGMDVMLVSTHASHAVPLNAMLVNEFGGSGTLPAARDSAVRTVRSKEHIYFEDDARRHIYEVIEGSVCIYKLMPDGRRQVVAFCYPGDLLGIGAGDEYAYNAEATSNTKLHSYPVAAIERLAVARPDLSHALLAFAMAELTFARDQLLALGRKSASERVCSFLLNLVEKKRARGGDGSTVDLAMTRSDIGDYLGLTIETVSRHFSRLRASGVIDLPQRGTVVIRDMDALESGAELCDGMV
jgi:CRP/FNR family transcriptional regulator